MGSQEKRFEIDFPKDDAKRIKTAAAALGMDAEEYIRWAVRVALKENPDSELGEERQGRKA
jgi:predicted DNA binding CopG/RHH family protein